MNDVYVIGVGMTPFGRFFDRSVKDLTRDAVNSALADSGCARSDIDKAFFSNATQAAIEGQFAIPGQIALRSMGFEGIPIVNVENACASGSTAFHLAYTFLAAGQGEIALAIGVEKMYHSDKGKSFAVFNGGWDVHEAQKTIDNLLVLGEGVTKPPNVKGNGETRSVFMDIYAALARFHMKTFGTTPRQIAAVAAKNHDHSVHNDLSQYRTASSIEEVLAARVISWPLTLPMCAPISDGASAAILCTGDALRRFTQKSAIRVDASVLTSGINRAPEEVDKHICHLAAKKAYEVAGIGPDDVHVAEVHDATAFAEILQTEALGFCEFGAGGHLAESGATKIGGRIPVNPSGGLESKGHPIGATGLGQIYELVSQLRGEAGKRQVPDARVAIAENGGGFYGIEEAVACITVLSR